MSLFENKSAEGDLVKLHTADHNMNSAGGSLTSGPDQRKHFPLGAFPCFPFLPGLPGTSPSPLSLNLTGQLEEASPASGQEEESPKSSPTGNKRRKYSSHSTDCQNGPFVFCPLTNISSEIHCSKASI